MIFETFMSLLNIMQKKCNVWWQLITDQRLKTSKSNSMIILELIIFVDSSHVINNKKKHIKNRITSGDCA